MDINNALARAQKLMLDPGFNNLVESKVAARRGRKLPGSTNDLSSLEEQAFGYSSNNNSFSAPLTGGYTPQYNPQYQAQMGHSYGTQPPVQILSETRQAPNQQNSKLPQNILESFSEMPPLSGDETIEIPQSYFGNAPIQQTQQYAPQQQYAGGIDYNIIKQMVKEAISECGKGLLNESAGSTFRGMRIAEGSVIQFIDNKGNLFEGTLRLKKKAQK